MKNDGINKEVIVRIIGDIVVIGFYVSMTVIEWRVLGRIDTSSLTKAKRTLLALLMKAGLVANVIGIGRRVFDIVKSFRDRNGEEQEERIEKLIKNYTGIDDEGMQQLKEAIEAFNVMDPSEMFEALNVCFNDMQAVIE